MIGDTELVERCALHLSIHPDFPKELDAIDEEVEELKATIDKFMTELKEANENKGFTNDTTKLMKEKLKSIKNSLIQEYILFTKCKHLKYIESGPHKVTKKMLTLVSNKSRSSSNKSLSGSLDSSYASSDKTSLSEKYNPKTKKKAKPKPKKQKKAQNKNNTYKSFSN